MCGETKPLCNAHLLPDSFKKIATNFKRAGARVVPVNQEDGRILSPVQTLPFDKSILCSDCDRLLGAYDKYLKEFLLSWADNRQREFDPRLNWVDRLIDVPGDWDRVHMGLLSVLLRFSFSNRHADIAIGTSHEAAAASFFLGNKSEDISRFSSMRLLGSPIVRLNGVADLTRICSSQPLHFRVEGAHIYNFDLFGLHALIKIGKAFWPSALRQLPSNCTADGKIPIRLINFEHTIIGRELQRVFGWSQT